MIAAARRRSGCGYWRRDYQERPVFLAFDLRGSRQFRPEWSAIAQDRADSGVRRRWRYSHFLPPLRSFIQASSLCLYSVRNHSAGSQFVKPAGGGTSISIHSTDRNLLLGWPGLKVKDILSSLAAPLFFPARLGRVNEGQASHPRTRVAPNSRSFSTWQHKAESVPRPSPGDVLHRDPAALSIPEVLPPGRLRGV